MSFMLHVFLHYSLSQFGFSRLAVVFSAVICFQSLIFNFALLFAFLTIFYVVYNIYVVIIEAQFDRNICP